MAAAMTTSLGPRERLLWWLAWGYFFAILASAYFVRFAVDALRSRGWLTLSFWLATALVAAAGVWLTVRARPRLIEIAFAATVAATYGLAFVLMTRIEERIHLFQYGLLALLVEAALAARAPGREPRRSGLRVYLAAAGLTAVAGLIDELWQGILPNRMYDTRDVAFNAGAGVLALCALGGWRRLRQARRSPQGEPSGAV